VAWNGADHLFAQDRSELLTMLNEAVGRLHVLDDPEEDGGQTAAA
jgi:hypothetical protein